MCNHVPHCNKRAYKIMYKLILLVRELRQKGAFKVSTRLLLLFLLVLGLWGATTPLDHTPISRFNDKFIHMTVFAGFAFLMDLATARKPFWLWKGLPLLMYGVVIEVLQNFTAYRSFELADIAADAFGITLYYMLKFSLRWLAVGELKT